MEEMELQNDLESQLKQTRKYFSKIGFLYLGGTLITFGVQWFTILIISTVKPEWLYGTTASLLVSMLPMYLLSMPLMILLVRSMKGEQAVKTYKISVGKMIQAFFMSYAILYVSNLAGVLLTTVIGMFKGSPVEDVLSDLVLFENKWIIFIFTVLAAPFYEEVIFRKLLIDRAVKYGEGVAVLLSGLLFGLFHGNINQFIYAFSLGLFLGFIYVKTRRLGYTVILHMVLNFMGGIVTSWILEKVNFQEMEQNMQMLMSNPSAGMSVSPSAISGLILMGVYILVLIMFVITGIVLLIIRRDKFKLSPGTLALPDGKRFAAVIVNPGMILYLGFWIIQIVRQLFM